MHRSSVAVIAALLALSTAILAQVERGTIVARVTDSTGLAVPRADIAVHNTGTNVSFQTKSDEAGGSYRYSGRDFRLTDVEGKVVKDILA
jgi:hypothetical protein